MNWYAWLAIAIIAWVALEPIVKAVIRMMRETQKGSCRPPAARNEGEPR